MAAAEPGAAVPALIPRPAQMSVQAVCFELKPTSEVIVGTADAEVRAVAGYLADHLRTLTGNALPVTERATSDGLFPAGSLVLLGGPGDRQAAGEEAYTLRITPTEVRLEAAHARGLFLGVQTLRQLAQPVLTTGPAPAGAACTFPCVEISDVPRYRWRGMLLDCGRHFMSKEFIKRYIDLLAYHKLNVLHWHLTEDQGWRVQIKKYPKLTEVGAWRGQGEQRYGGFYTQDDVREIVAYARSRYVTIVPEIEMPGHCQAALAAYPELSCTGGPFEVSTQWGVREDVYCAGNERTFEFLEDVLSEVIALFPSEYVHIGGDECPKARWQACPKCQARMRAEGLRDENELQSYFVRRIERFLNSHGRRLIGWDEILEGGVAPDATVQSWRGLKGAVAAAGANHDVICSPTTHCYLDYAQAKHPEEPTQMGYVPLETVYSFEPTPPELSAEAARHILGAEGNMWTEHAPEARVDWQVFPRLCALAEVMWSPREARDWGDFQARLRVHYARLDALGVNYYVPAPRFVRDGQVVTQGVFSGALAVSLDNPFGAGELFYTVDGSEPTAASLRYQAPVELKETTVLKARTLLPNGRTSCSAEARFERSD